MIRGHRRKGFKDPPKPIFAIAPTEIPKTIEEKHRTPSPSTVPEVRNKRLFDSSGYHDPKNALQPAKIRLRKMKLTPTKESLQTSPPNTLESPSIISQPSPTLKAPLFTIEDLSSPAASLQPQQKQPAPPPTLHSQTIVDTQNSRPLNPLETNKPPAIKRGRRIKITPRREPLINLSQKAIGWPKISQHLPAIIHPNFSYVNQRIAVLSEHQPNLGMFTYKIASNLIDSLVFILLFCYLYENRSIICTATPSIPNIGNCTIIGASTNFLST